EAGAGGGGDPRTAGAVPGRAVRGRGRGGGGDAEGDAAEHDRVRSDDLPDFACARDRGATVQPCRHHSSRTPGGAGVAGGAAARSRGGGGGRERRRGGGAGGGEAHARGDLPAHSRRNGARAAGALMAELAGEISTRAQLAAIAAVRWRLMLNSMRTARGTMEVVAQVGASVWLAILGSGGGIGFGVATWYFLSHGQPAVLLLFAWGLFLFWQIFPLAATAFTEQADTSNLTRFPLSFRAYVIVRVAFGAFDVATLVGSLCLLGSVVGAACASPALLPWAVAGALLFAAFNVVLAQTIFAWIERRKTREIVMVLFFFVIIGFQFIGPIARHWSGARVDVGAMAAWLPLAEWLPPGLAVHALGQAAAGAWLTAAGAVLELAGCAAATTALLGVRLRADFRGELLGETVGATPKA